MNDVQHGVLDGWVEEVLPCGVPVRRVVVCGVNEDRF